MKNLFGEEVEEPKIIEGKKPKKVKPVYTIADYDIYRIQDEEYSYLVCARSRGQARSIYLRINDLSDWDFVDVKISINKLGKFKQFIREEDLNRDCNPWEDNYWTKAVYKAGGSFYIYSDEEDDKYLSLEEFEKLDKTDLEEYLILDLNNYPQIKG